jgi:hypothetical protein
MRKWSRTSFCLDAPTGAVIMAFAKMKKGQEIREATYANAV